MTDILIKALQQATRYSHPVSEFEVIETHLSYVILTGEFAYKIKKPLNLGFQDFSTLEKRKFYCELEVQLNKRLAPHIYIEAFPITGTPANPELNGQGAVIEYAIKMHQFKQDCLLSHMAQENKLGNAIIEDIALQTAQFHLKATACDPNVDFGNPEAVYAPMSENFNALKTLKASKNYTHEISQLEAWCHHQFNNLKALLATRKKNGFIRACHGDFHLGNMVLLDNKATIFDCIEFNESFRWTDVMNDIGFLAMDLDRNHLSHLSHLFINKYLEQSFDYQGTLLLKFYQSYRAMVRAKISALQLDQVAEDSPLNQKLKQDLQDFLQLGLSYASASKPTLSITFGLSGSGKSLYTEQMLMQTGAIRLRADIFRKHLFGFNVFESSLPHQKEQLYSQDATKHVYTNLQTTARLLLQAGISVIIDATCLKAWQRDLFSALAQELEVPFSIYTFDAPLERLQERVKLRAKVKQDPSEADQAVLQMQIALLEPLSTAEKDLSIAVNSAEIDSMISAYSWLLHK